MPICLSHLILASFSRNLTASISPAYPLHGFVDRPRLVPSDSESIDVDRRVRKVISI